MSSYYELILSSSIIEALKEDPTRDVTTIKFN